MIDYPLPPFMFMEDCTKDVALDIVDFLNDYNNSNRESEKLYHIVEYFPKLKEPIKKYTVSNLSMIYDETLECLISSDINDILSTKHSLYAMLIKSIDFVGFQKMGNRITLTLDDGYIQIFYRDTYDKK